MKATYQTKVNEASDALYNVALKYGNNYERSFAYSVRDWSNSTSPKFGQVDEGKKTEDLTFAMEIVRGLLGSDKRIERATENFLRVYFQI